MFMSQIIYVDVLVFLNVIVTFLLLLAVARLVHISPLPWHYVFGSLLGGASSLIMLLPEMGFLFSALTKLLFSVVVTGITFLPRSFAAAAKVTGYFFTVSFIFAGMMLFAASLPGVYLVQYNNGTAYINFSFESLVGACVICYTVTCILGRVTRHRAAGEIVFTAEIISSGKCIKTTALLDTGNSLSDPFTGENMIVADYDTVKQLLPDCIKEYYAGGENIKGIKLVPCKTVSSQAVLPVFRVNCVVLKSKEKNCIIKNVLIAVSREKLSRVIVPFMLYENSERGNKLENITK